MKKYEKYKDSKNQFLGSIPNSWDKVKFNHYVFLRHGHQFRDFDFTSSGIKIIKITQLLANGNMDTTNVSYIEENRLDEFKDIIIEEGDILMALTGGTIGKIIKAKDVKEPLLQNYRVGNFFPLNDELSKDFLFWVLSSQNILDQIFYDQRETGQPNIGKEDFGRMAIALPETIEEQTTIANYLDNKIKQIDELIADKKRILELYEEEKTAIINQAVTKGINPVVPMKDSGIVWLGEIPEHWDVKRLKYVISQKLMYGANESAEEENRDNPRYIRITDFGNDGKLKEDTFKSLPYEKANDYLLSDGDILFARSGATVGKTFQFKNYESEACFAGYLIKATPNPTIMDSDFLYYYTKSGAYENWKGSIFNQATIQNIGADKYAFLEIPTPTNIEEQQSIVRYIETKIARINAKKSKTKKLIDLLTEYRTALISEVVTGKIKVT